MNRPRVIALVLLSLLMAGVAGMLWRKHLAAPDLADLSREEYPFNAMRMPVRRVTSWLAKDGHSITLTVTDATGARFRFAFPHDGYREGTSFLRPFHGAEYERDTGAVPFRNPARAKEICIALLEDHGEETRYMYHRLSETPPPDSGIRFREWLRKWLPFLK